MPWWLVPKPYAVPFSLDSIVSLSLSFSLWVSPCSLGCSAAICWCLSARLCVPVTPSTQPPNRSPSLQPQLLALYPSSPLNLTDRQTVHCCPGCHCVHVPSMSSLGFASETEWEEVRGGSPVPSWCTPLSHLPLLLLLWWNGGFWVLEPSKEDYRQFLLICNQISHKEREEDEGEARKRRRWCLSPCFKSIQMRIAVQPQPMSKESNLQHLWKHKAVSTWHFWPWQAS